MEAPKLNDHRLKMSPCEVLLFAGKSATGLRKLINESVRTSMVILKLNKHLKTEVLKKHINI